MNETRSVVVTGASTGIGWAITEALVEHNIGVFASVRRESDTLRLRDAFGDMVIPLLFDVTDEVAVRKAVAQVAESIGRTTLLGLVNNAGIAVPGPLLDQPIADFRRQIEVNLTGQLIVTQAFAPLLGADKTRTGMPGRIVNMSSVSGRIAAPFIGGYAASKHALEGFSESLRRELLLYGIDVIIIAPGVVKTPIWDKAENVDLAVYERSDFLPIMRRFNEYVVASGRKGLPAERIGHATYHALTTRHPRTRYSLVPNLLTDWILPTLLPRRWLDDIFARSLGFPKAK
ncbi:MAG: SDR family NAD(P)-dependent oxidoreductase [Fibrella sp.]|nr:SDR family NAD(P)-dependent oxidoreductase [Armatimonadota bacterium]